MAEDPSNFNKLAGCQALIPHFDNVSAVTPRYFVDTLEAIAKTANCTESEKLLLLKSRVQGDALTQIINNVDLENEQNYENFKQKFLDFFSTKTSLATRQQLFSNCRMSSDEGVKIYAARVSTNTQKFFGNADISKPEVKSLYEQTRLAKFLEGLLPKYKSSILVKDPQSFQDAVNFIETLQVNESTTQHETICNVGSTDKEMVNLIESHAKQTHETIAAIQKQVENLQLHSVPRHETNTQHHFQNNPYTTQAFSGPPQPHTHTQAWTAGCGGNTCCNETISHRFPLNDFEGHRYPHYAQNFCENCGRNNHTTSECYAYNPEHRFNQRSHAPRTQNFHQTFHSNRGRFNTRNHSPHPRRSNRGRSVRFENNNTSHSGNLN